MSSSATGLTATIIGDESVKPIVEAGLAEVATPLVIRLLGEAEVSPGALEGSDIVFVSRDRGSSQDPWSTFLEVCHPRIAKVLLGAPREILDDEFADDATDVLPTEASATAVRDMALALLARRGLLHQLLKQFDENATAVAHDSECEWARCMTGVVGMIHIERKLPVASVRMTLSRQIAYAHSVLDSLSQSEFTADDVWNLLLCIAVPWTRETAEAIPELFEVLSASERDLTGSRKLLLWQGSSPLEHLASLGTASTLWLPSSQDPLREALEQATRDPEEHEALQVLFQRRILDQDVDAVIEALGKRRKM